MAVKPRQTPRSCTNVAEKDTVKPKIHPHLPGAKRGYGLKRNKPQKGAKRNAEVKGLSAMTCMGRPTILVYSKARTFIN